MAAIAPRMMNIPTMNAPNLRPSVHQAGSGSAAGPAVRWSMVLADPPEICGAVIVIWDFLPWTATLKALSACSAVGTS